MQYYLAVDIGASSGRHILSHIEDGKIILEEVYRFPNGFKEENGLKYWDDKELFTHILNGMKECKKLGKIPVSMGVDTWGVDFALLDADDKLIGKVVSYRDDRTKGMDEEVFKIIPHADLYARTGIQKQQFNTIYQLMAYKLKAKDQLDRAKTLLMFPDYFHFLLSGEKSTEYTEATTGQLISPITKDWDFELIEMLGFPKEIFTKVNKPGTILSEHLKKEVADEVGFDCKVTLPATHDTGSAVAAVPSLDEDFIYISSGTWSLMGTELKEAICTPEAFKINITNEGGYDYRFRFLKNIMGMWMINSVRKELAPDMDFGTICDLAEKESISSIVPANDERFLAPKSMTEEIQKACKETGQEVPEGIAQLSEVIYNSLAKCYSDVIDEIEDITKKKYSSINIIGGGSKADYLNRLTANYTGRTVYAGPTEASALGNVVIQMIGNKEFKDLREARECIFKTFEVTTYKP